MNSERDRRNGEIKKKKLRGKKMKIIIEKETTTDPATQSNEQN